MTWQTARGYCWARALRILGERPMVTLLAVVLAGIALAVPACVFMFAMALGPVLPGAPVAEMSAFVAPGTPAADVKALSARLAALDGVAAAKILTRDQAWSDLQRRFKDAPPAPDARLNALPDIIVVEFMPSTPPSVIQAAATAAAKVPRVESVQADLDWYRRLWSLLEATRNALVPITLVAGLLLIALILGVVRLATAVDAGELRVLAQIGADRDFVRRPAVYAGALLFVMAAAVGLGAVAATQYLAGRAVGELGRAFGFEVLLSFPPWPLVVAFVAACVLTGALAAFYFASRALSRSRPVDQLD